MATTLLTPQQSIAQAQGVTDPLMTNEEYIARAQNYLIQNSVTVTQTEPVLESPLESIKKSQTWPLEDQILYKTVTPPPVKPNLPTYAELQSTIAENLRLSNLDSLDKALYIENGYNIAPPISAPNSGYVPGSPSTPSLARGIVFGTVKHNNNQKRAHVCGFIDEMRKNDKLKAFIKSTAQKIRDGIRYVMKMLGFSDTSGTFTYITAKLKEAVRWLKTVQKFLKDVINFEKYVLAYITRIKAIIQWIMSLPAALIGLLAQCLAKFLRLVKNVMSDFFTELTAGPSEIGDAIQAAKDLANESVKTINLAATAATGAVVVVGAATTGLLMPVSASELSAANKTIANYSKTIPSGETTPITQNKSRP